MKKLIKCGIGVLIAMLLSFKAYTTETPTDSIPETDKKWTPNPKGLYWADMPVVCGTADAVAAYIEKQNYILVYIAVGKQGGRVEGTPVFLITEYITMDMKKSTAVVTTPNFSESCILFTGFDVQFKKNMDLKPSGKKTNFIIKEFNVEE